MFSTLRKLSLQNTPKLNQFKYTIKLTYTPISTLSSFSSSITTSKTTINKTQIRTFFTKITSKLFPSKKKLQTEKQQLQSSFINSNAILIYDTPIFSVINNAPKIFLYFFLPFGLLTFILAWIAYQQTPEFITGWSNFNWILLLLTWIAMYGTSVFYNYRCIKNIYLLSNRKLLITTIGYPSSKSAIVNIDSIVPPLSISGTRRDHFQQLRIRNDPLHIDYSYFIMPMPNSSFISNDLHHLFMNLLKYNNFTDEELMEAMKKEAISKEAK
jgi:hypothetical protein